MRHRKLPSQHEVTKHLGAGVCNSCGCLYLASRWGTRLACVPRCAQPVSDSILHIGGSSALSLNLWAEARSEVCATKSKDNVNLYIFSSSDILVVFIL